MTTNGEATSDKLTAEEWLEQVGRNFATNMPDQYPDGYADFLALDAFSKGGYDKYFDGEYPEGIIYVPVD